MPRRADLCSRWIAEVRRSGLFLPGERVGVAVSGGPDSVLLLNFMRRLASKLGLQLAVVHFNHHLRGAESESDEAFVRELSRHYGLEFIRGEADVQQAAKQERRNLEATARELRYRFFFSLIRRARLDKLATAHTANDQAETVLLRLLRGTGTRGLGGIYPSLEGKIIRPFLSLTRAEVESELKARKLEFRFDSTNRDLRRTRNRIRKELIPALEKEFNPEIVLLLKELADRARDDESFLEDQAREHARAWRVREGGEEKIPVKPLVEFPPAIARRVLRQMISAVRGNLRGISHAHIEALLRFAESAQSGKSLELPGGLAARKEFSWLVLGLRSAGGEGAEFAYPVKVPGKVSVPQLGLTFRFKIVGLEELGRAYNSLGMAGLDRLKLTAEPVLRSWKAGDRFRPPGSRKPLKVKELFRLHKVPLKQRKTWPVLECGREIIWVRGFPASGSVAVTPETREVVVISEEVEPTGKS
jgi:tRNA(Ile)-lysidine synthase